MKEKQIQLILMQLCVLVISTAILISQPKLAGIVAALLLVSLAFSFGSTLASVFRHISSQGNEQQVLCVSSLATHIGGIICYMVMLDVALRQVA